MGSNRSRARQPFIQGIAVLSRSLRLTLPAEPNVVGLYKKLGYVEDAEGVKGLAFQTKKSKLAARV